MKSERIEQIEQYICGHEIVTMQELLDEFGISMNTLRRDLNELSARGSIEKVYGGARKKTAEPLRGDQLASYSERNVRNREQKEQIAQLAAAFVEEDDMIFIDTGTSTVPMLSHLQSFQHLTIITNSVYVLHSALEYPRFTVIGLPGNLKHKTASLIGEQCLEMLGRYNIIAPDLRQTGGFQLYSDGYLPWGGIYKIFQKQRYQADFAGKCVGSSG